MWKEDLLIYTTFDPVNFRWTVPLGFHFRFPHSFANSGFKLLSISNRNLLTNTTFVPPKPTQTVPLKRNFSSNRKPYGPNH